MIFFRLKIISIFKRLKPLDVIYSGFKITPNKLLKNKMKIKLNKKIFLISVEILDFPDLNF